MPFVAVGDHARISIEYRSVDGAPAANVFYVRDNLGGIDFARLDYMIDVVEGWAQSSWDANVSEDWAMTRIVARSMDSETAPVADRTVNIPGLVVQDMLPGQNTACMSLRTGIPGRSYRGRLYHVGLHKGNIDLGRLTSSTLTALLVVYSAFRTTWPIDDMQLMVVSFIADGEPRVTPVSTPVTSIILVDDKVDSQDRRKG